MNMETTPKPLLPATESPTQENPTAEPLAPNPLGLTRWPHLGTQKSLTWFNKRIIRAALEGRIKPDLLSSVNGAIKNQISIVLGSKVEVTHKRTGKFDEYVKGLGKEQRESLVQAIKALEVPAENV